MPPPTAPLDPDTDPPWKAALGEAAAWLRIAPKGALLELMAPAGFVGRGVVYVSVGVLALLAALELAPKALGIVDAMAAWGRWPIGVALIWLTALGLCGFCAFRFLQALLDADGHGRSLKGWGVRAGQAVSGVAYGLMAWSLLGLLDGLEDLNEAEDRDEVQMAAGAVLALPHGDILLLAAGAVILGFSAGSVAQGAFQSFAKRLGCSPRACWWAVALARVGYVGRGVCFAPVGLFLAEAGLDARASSAHDFGGALAILEAQPFGSAVLALMAVGLIAFGAFALFEAGFRRIAMPGPRAVN